jgi:hypothetical protein
LRHTGGPQPQYVNGRDHRWRRHLAGVGDRRHSLAQDFAGTNKQFAARLRRTGFTDCTCATIRLASKCRGREIGLPADLGMTPFVYSPRWSAAFRSVGCRWGPVFARPVRSMVRRHVTFHYCLAESKFMSGHANRLGYLPPI